MNAQLVRNSLRLAVAVFITAAIALRFERIEFVWYPVLAAVVCVDDSDDQTFKAASGRILGTILGGLVTFLVHTVLDGWIGVLVSLLLMLPLLRLLGWQSAISTATLVSLLFLMVPRYAALDWTYAFNRGLDTAVGCLIAILVGLLFWPRNGLEQLHQEERALQTRLAGQIGGYIQWLSGEGERPSPLPAAPFTACLSRLDALVEQERRGPRQRQLLRRRWPARLELWRGVEHHWLALERLLAALPSALPESAQGPGSPLWQVITAVEAQLPPIGLPGPAASAGAANKLAASAVTAAAAADRSPADLKQAGADRNPTVPQPVSAAADRGAGAPPAPLQPAGPAAADWQEFAHTSDLPPLLLLALGSEQRRLTEGLNQLCRLAPC